MEKKNLNSKIIAVICIIITILAVGASVYMFISNKNKPAPTPVASGGLTLDTSAKDTDNTVEDPLADRYVELVGFDDLVVTEGTAVSLPNLESNGDFVIKYVIKDNKTGEVYFETDLIPSGKSVDWNVSIPSGEYEIAIVQSPYWLNPTTNDYQPLTGGTNVIKVTVR